MLSEPENRSSTIKEYLAEWLDVYAKVHCKPSTYRGYKRSVEKHLIPAFGHLALEALKRDAVKRFVARKSEELVVRTDKNRVHSVSPGAAHEPLRTSKRKARWTVMGYLVPLKAAYNQAMEDGLVSMNPVARLGRLLRSRGDRREHIQPLTGKEVRRAIVWRRDGDEEPQDSRGPWVFRSPRGQRWDERNLRRGLVSAARGRRSAPGTVSRSPAHVRVADGGAISSVKIRTITTRALVDSGDDGHLFAPVPEWESRLGGSAR